MEHSRATSFTRPRWDELLCDWALLGFGIWTLLANVTVLTGGSLDRLLLYAGLALAIGVLLARGRWRMHATSTECAPTERTPSWIRGLQVALLGAGAMVAFRLVPAGRFGDLWLVAVGTLLALAVLELALTRGSLEPAPDRRVSVAVEPAWHALALFGLALIAAVATLVLHRPAADETFYINMAVGAADAPGLQLLARDTLHGLAEPYPTMVLYHLQAFELLAGALARITGISALTIAQLLLPACAAFLLPLTLARLFRLLVPRRWLACVAVVVLIYLLVGDQARGYGNFGFVRMFMGKAVFCSVVIPLIAAYAIEFGRAPRAARRACWVRLVLVQVAAVGLTSSAIWIAPTVVGLGLLCVLEFRWRSALYSLVGLTSCAYPIAAGLWLMGKVEAAVLAVGVRVRLAKLFDKAFDQVLGQGALAALFAAALFTAWGASGTRLARRFTIVFPLGFLLLFWSPYLAPFMSEKVTGNVTYWRVFWLVPLPLLVAMILTAPLEHIRRPRWLGGVLTLALTSILFWGRTVPLVSVENRTWIGWPKPKMLAPELAAARAVVEHTGPEQHVLAPVAVGRWIPTLHDHPFPLCARVAYITSQHELLGASEAKRRRRLTAAVDGKDLAGFVVELPDAVEDYGLTAICLSADAAADVTLIDALERLEFVEVWSSGSYVVWRAPAVGH